MSPSDRHLTPEDFFAPVGTCVEIYRTWIVWNRNIWAVLLPILIDVAHFIVTCTTIHGYLYPEHLAPETLQAWYQAAFPLSFAQNVLTTGLIWYKIRSQCIHSKANGVFQTGGALTLDHAARYLIETAAIYPIQLLIIIILQSFQHPAVCMVITIMVPSIGITFVLMTVRVYLGGVPLFKPGIRNVSSWTPQSQPDYITDAEVNHCTSLNEQGDCINSRRHNGNSRGPTDFNDHAPFATFYLVMMTLMWLVAALHMGISIQRFLRVFVLELELNSADTYTRLLDATRWDTTTHMALAATMTWLGDILVIYRTYIVWERNLWIIALPVLIDIANMVVNSMTMYWFTHPNLVPRSVLYSWYLPVYPLIFAQNVLTTGLLAYKIWSQHRESVAHGVAPSSDGLTLAYVARIIIESAIVYTLELLVTIVLITIRHPAAGMVIVCMVPSIGIVFVLLAIRVYFGGKPMDGGKDKFASHLPSWLGTSDSDDDDMEFNRPPSTVTTARVDLALSAAKETEPSPNHSNSKDNI
ncbi:hypothetical protein CVT24_010804 [Panaeolus cyanescens]|uniref:Uncharacterized protein n=1 Tax=Panaeolus cyanescens TaxID=181874 RepID=A0A409VGX2_9AGAR|nr:hypothetical protein CVT24_010804 [Panaeolus cyanescens]